MAQYKALSVAGDKAGFMSSKGNMVGKDDTVYPTALLALADTLDVMLVPAGTRVQELFMTNADLCTSGTLGYKLGYRKVDSSGSLTDDDDYFAAADTTSWRAAVTLASPTRHAFAPITFNEDVYITATVTTAASGTAITSGSVTTYMRGVAVGIK